MTIQNKIDEFLQVKNVSRKDRPRSGKWSPSSFGRCYRLQYWNRQGMTPTNPPDARALRIFAVGSLFHDFVQGFYKDDTAKIEVKCETDDILGFADLVLDDEVVDIKSQHSRGFWHMTKPGYDVAREKYANILQVMAYCMLLNKQKARLVFVSKDDLCIQEYGFFYDKWKDELDNELVVLRSYWKNNQLPPAEPRAYGGKDCEYCQYLDLCEQQGDCPYKPKEK